MNRRAFLSAVKGSVIVSVGASTAGCSANTGSSRGDDVDPTEESFQYFFVDETGTLGGVVDGNEPPEDAANWQVATNTLTEGDWQEKQANDVQVARDYLAGELDRLPQHQGVEGTVEGIVQRTGEIYNNPETALNPDKNSGDELLLERLQQDDDAERFTRALIHASQTETGGGLTSAGSDNVVPNIAEYALRELGLDFPEYELYSAIAAEPVSGNSERVIEESVREREDGAVVGTTGMLHLISILTYEREGNLQIRYVENIGAVKPSEFEEAIRPPEESEYRKPIDEGPFEVKGVKAWPEHYATGYEQQKIQEMQEMGILKEDLSDSVALGMEPIDDGLNDRSILPNDGYDFRLSDKIKSGIEEFVVKPSVERKRNLKHLRRATYLVLEKQIAEDYKGQPVYGAEDPLRIEGAIQNPTFHHEPAPSQ